MEWRVNNALSFTMVYYILLTLDLYFYSRVKITVLVTKPLHLAQLYWGINRLHIKAHTAQAHV